MIRLFSWKKKTPSNYPNKTMKVRDPPTPKEPYLVHSWGNLNHDDSKLRNGDSLSRVHKRWTWTEKGIKYHWGRTARNYKSETTLKITRKKGVFNSKKKEKKERKKRKKKRKKRKKKRKQKKENRKKKKQKKNKKIKAEDKKYCLSENWTISCWLPWERSSKVARLRPRSARFLVAS